MLWCPMILEQLPSAVRERHQHRSPVFVAIERSYGSNQFGRLQPFEVAMAQVSRASPIVEEFVDGDDTEGTDRGQRPHLGSAEFERVTVQEHSFALTATRQVQALAKNVARVDRVAPSDVVH